MTNAAGDTEETKPPEHNTRALLGPRLAAVCVVALGVVALVGAAQIRAVGGFVAVGPAAMPIVVGVGLIVLGILLALRTTVVPDLDLARHVKAEAQRTDWRTTGLTLLGVVLYAVALAPLGYVLATAVFMPVTARILGSDRPIRDVVIGVAVAVVVYVGFTHFLGVRLPAGMLALSR